MVFQNNFIYFQEQYTEHLLVALARFYGSSHYKLENWCRHYFFATNERTQVEMCFTHAALEYCYSSL